MAEELQPELDQLFDKEKNPFTENQVRKKKKTPTSTYLNGQRISAVSDRRLEYTQR